PTNGLAKRSSGGMVSERRSSELYEQVLAEAFGAVGTVAGGICGHPRTHRDGYRSPVARDRVKDSELHAAGQQRTAVAPARPTLGGRLLLGQAVEGTEA